jgi:hypothetical protein
MSGEKVYWSCSQFYVTILRMKPFLLLFMSCCGLFASNPSEEAILKATYLYIDFINHMGEGSVDALERAAICAPECQKIFNGKLEARNRDEFVAELLSIKKNAGGWKVRPVDILVSGRTSVIRLILTIENTGIFTAMVILRWSPAHRVIEINEVFNRYEGEQDEIPKIR